MPRLFFRRGKKKKIDRDISTTSASASLTFQLQQQQEGTLVSATDWIDHTLGNRNDNNNNNSSNNNNNMDLHVNVPDHHHNHHHPSTDTAATTTTATTTNVPKQYYYNNRHVQQQQRQQSQVLPSPPSFLSPENVASIPPPGLSAPSQPIFITIPNNNNRNTIHHVDSSILSTEQQQQQLSSPNERIVLTYVTVQPKSSYPSTHKNRTSNGTGGSSSSTSNNGTRSLYRPLTTSLGLSSLNGNSTMNTNSNQNPSSIASTSSGSNNNHASTTSTTSTSSSSTSNNNLTERVLMCYDITSNNSKSQNNNNMDTNTGTSSYIKSTKQSVPLLRWHTSNLSSLFVNRTKTTTTATAGKNTNTSNNMITTTSNNNSSKRRALPTTITESGTNSNNNSSHSCSTGTSSTISNNHITVESTQQLPTTTSTRTPITPNSIPLEDRLLRERLKVVSNSKASSGSLTQFHYAKVVQPAMNNNMPINETKTSEQIDEAPSNTSRSHVRLLIPARGSLYIQDGIDLKNEQASNKGNNNIDPLIRNEKDNSNNNYDHTNSNVRCICIHDKNLSNMSATDAQLSPDGTMIAWTHEGEIYVQSAEPRTFDTSLLQNIDTSSFAIDDSFITAATSSTTPPIRISYGACQTETCCITHGVADFVAQEEMDRYRGFWWHPNSNAILFTRNDESNVPIYRIMHQSNSSTIPSFSSSGNNSHQQLTDHSSSQHYESNNSSSCNGLFTPSKNTNTSEFEDHRYPFAGKMNPSVKLGLVQIDRNSVLELANTSKATTVPQKATTSVCLEQRDGIEGDETSTSFYMENDITDNKKNDDDDNDPMNITTTEDIAAENWSNCIYYNAQHEANEYLARVHILPDGRAIAQWQNRAQTCSILYLLDMNQSTFVSTDNTTKLTENIVDGQLLVTERSDIWINLHHMFYFIPRPIHPKECIMDESIANGSRPGMDMPFPLPAGSFSFIFASERTGYCHLYLYTYCPGFNQNKAVLIRPLTSGNWTVENILGVDLAKDIVYFTGTLDSVLERHLYALPILNVKNKHTWRFGSFPTTVPPTSETQSLDGISISQTPFNSPATILDESANHNGGVRRGLSKVMHALSGKGSNSITVGCSDTSSSEHTEIFLTKSASGENSCLTTPTRLTLESGMHSIVMDDKCRYFVDTSSDVDRPTSVKIYELPTDNRMTVCWNATIYNAAYDDLFALSTTNISNEYKTNGTLDMVKCLPPPEMISFPTSDGKETLHAALYRPNPQLFGPGPHPLVCAVYGGPHVQRVNKSWSQSADMRAQRLRSLGFCVVKCDNRGSSRRGLAFESAISRRLGRVEVLDQVAAVRQLVVRGIVDPSRVGVYGWSYGGYLSAMCLCRAPDVFHVAVAGAPVTSWDGYDTHYTERYMGLPDENPSGYRESAVFDHVPNMKGKLMIVHGLIDENVHFRHTTRLINKLIAAGKDYDLLIFPEERHSPRRLRDRIYMEQRISEYFVRHLQPKDDIDLKSSDAVVGLYENKNGQGLRPMAGHL
jgi:dienelactone hydrolase